MPNRFSRRTSELHAGVVSAVAVLLLGASAAACSPQPVTVDSIAVQSVSRGDQNASAIGQEIQTRAMVALAELAEDATPPDEAGSGQSADPGDAPNATAAQTGEAAATATPTGAEIPTPDLSSISQMVDLSAIQDMMTQLNQMGSGSTSIGVAVNPTPAAMPSLQIQLTPLPEGQGVIATPTPAP
ncbi:MAG TPA: hypothetical protein VFC51_14965 [Chloroflexota bacterium]|nr:hypothetical protein [Chloroflexota bacterium]